MKRLFTQLLVLMAFVSANALEIGEYMYSPTSKFKVIRENLVVNGNFAELFDNGWTSETGSAVNGEVWSTTTEDGRTVVKVEQQNVEAGNALANAWQLAGGLYAVSYWAKVESGSIVTTTTSGQNNYINFFASVDGVTNSRAISGAESISSTWTQVVDTIFVNAEMEFLVFNASGLPSGTVLTDFEIYPVEEVYDTRIVDRLIKYAENLLNEPDLTEGKDDFGGVLETMKDMIQDPSQSEDTEAMEGLIVQFNEEFDKFMNLNGGNTNSGDWTKVGGKNWNNLNNNNFVGGYWTVGGRWGFFPNAPFARNSAGDMADLERVEGEGYILTAGIQASMDLGAIGVKVERTDLDPGKYFFAIEAQAVAASNKSAPYGADHTKLFVGPSIFVGNDTLVMRPANEAELEAANPNYHFAEVADTMSGYHWKRYYYIAEVKEGETVRAGFLFPAYDDKRGGRVSLRNPEFRMIGKSEMQLSWEAAVKNVITQQKELKNRLDNYMADVADYSWEKDSLQRAIDIAQPIYEESLNSVDAEGNCTVEVSEAGVEELNALQTSLLAQVRALGNAKNWVINQNAIQETLKTTIADAQAVLDDPKNAGGDAGLRAELQGVVAQGQALLDNISELNRYDDFKAAIDAINAAVEAFKITTASRENPAELGVKNPFLASYSGDRASYKATDWNTTSENSNGGWKAGKDVAGFENGTNARFDRGNTAAPKNKLQQNIVVSNVGVYEFVAQAYAYNNYKNNQDKMKTFDEEGNLLSIHSGCNLFFGLDGAADSTCVLTDSVYNKNAGEWQNVVSTSSKGDSYTNSDNTSYQYMSPWARNYTLVYKKTTSEPETLEFGFSTLDNVAVCCAGFGGVHVRFCGSIEAYEAGIHSAAVELLDTPEAIYTISGVRVNKSTMGKGLYIINGKKYVVK